MIRDGFEVSMKRWAERWRVWVAVERPRWLCTTFTLAPAATNSEAAV
jgi:hypothetical protein